MAGPFVGRWERVLLWVFERSEFGCLWPFYAFASAATAFVKRESQAWAVERRKRMKIFMPTNYLFVSNL
jgi:hypothetical protein